MKTFHIKTEILYLHPEHCPTCAAILTPEDKEICLNCEIELALPKIPTSPENTLQMA